MDLRCDLLGFALDYPVPLAHETYNSRRDYSFTAVSSPLHNLRSLPPRYAARASGASLLREPCMRR